MQLALFTMPPWLLGVPPAQVHIGKWLKNTKDTGSEEMKQVAVAAATRGLPSAGQDLAAYFSA